MATTTLISSKKSSVGGPYCYYTFKAEETSRSSSAVTLKFTVTAKLASSESYIGTGIGLVAGVYVAGAWKTWTLKSTTESLESWSGTSAHSKSYTASISTSVSTTKLTGIKVRVLRSDSLGDACQLSATSASDIDISSSAKYTIKFNANGGTGAPSNVTKTHGVNITLPTTTPTRDSSSDSGTVTTYNFKGWGTSASAAAAAYQPGGTYSANGNATLHAVWGSSSTSMCMVAYVVDGGLFYYEQVANGTTITVTTKRPGKASHTFSGWSTTEGSTSISATPGTSITVTKDLTFYAVFSPWRHTVSFNVNGGTGTVTGFTKTADIDALIPDTIPARSGYAFKCWNTDSSGTGTNYYPGEPYTRDSTVNLTLYAIWVENNILIYSNGNCRAVEFVESTKLYGAYDDGGGAKMSAPEFIEEFGGGCVLKANAMYFNEIIEQ